TRLVIPSSPCNRSRATDRLASLYSPRSRDTTISMAFSSPSLYWHGGVFADESILIQQVPQFGNPLAPFCNRRANGYAQQGRKAIDIDFKADPGSFVHHIDCKGNRQPGFHELQGENKHAFQILGIYDMQDDVSMFVQEQGAGDPLLVAVGAKGI